MSADKAPSARANQGLHANIIAFVQSQVNDHASRIVDLGCGSGAFLYALRDAGYINLVGIDIQPPAANDGAIQFLALDLDTGAVPLGGGSADLITAIEVVEHVENLGSFFAEVRRLLADGGHLLLTTPNVHSLECRLRFLLNGKLKQFDEIGDPTHIAPIFLFPIKKIIARHGLEIVKLWGFPEDGASPTSRPGLRFASRILTSLGLTSDVKGDNLCMLLRKSTTTDTQSNKSQQLTAHYSPHESD